MRRPHYLKYNAGVEIPTRCVFIDTETTPDPVTEDIERHKLRLGSALYKRRHRGSQWSSGEWLDFTNNAALWEWVTGKVKPGSKLYLYAHNLIYDLTITQGMTWMTSHGWKVVKAIVDDPPTAIQFRKDKRSIMMLDSFNYFRTSLASLGSSIGLEKMAMPSMSSPGVEWAAYCRRDVLVLSTAMIGYFNFLCDNKMGNYQITLAGQAFAAYRHRFMTTPIYIDDNPKALGLARRAYHGGRTEAFYIGKRQGAFATLDVNSMYPAVMAGEYFPAKLWTVINLVTLDEMAVYLKDYCIIAEVAIDTPDPVYPVYNNGKLIFPVGKFTTVLSTPELQYAQNRGHLLGVKQAAIYYKSPLFRAYVDELYRLRRVYISEDNKVYAWLCKILLNSLYGKFGQLGRVYEEVGETDPMEVRVWSEWDADSKTMHHMRAFAGIIQELTPAGESYNSHPAIAAHVTAYARMDLWRLINIVGIDNVYYVDTDSLTINKTGLDRLPDEYIGSDLGQLKLEARFRHLIIYGAKDYIFGDKTRIKGIRSRAKLIKPGIYQQDRFSKFKSMLRSGDLDQMLVYKQTKHLKRVYDKGIVTRSGRVRPLSLPLPGV